MLSSITVISQQNNICFVKYSDNRTNWSYLHWFDNSKLTFTYETKYQVSDFPVEIDGKYIKTTDTIKFKKEYLEYKEGLYNEVRKIKQPITQREYTSNVVKRTQYANENKEKYFVLDTIAEMNNWEITEDTLNILGFNCQKAVINYKAIKYIAYFTQKLPYPAGPRNFRGLPGLILKVDSEDGSIGYIATEIKIPYTGMIPVLETDGILISQKQYSIIADENNKKKLLKMNNFLKNPSIKQN